MTPRLKEAVLADIDGLAQRHPKLIGPDWGARLVTMAVLGILAAAFVISIVTLDANWPRFLTGWSELGKIVTLMFPPEYGSQRNLVLWTTALAETLAIAMLGTLAAAALALPFGFLAARNVVPSWIFRFSIRRWFDSIRGVDTLIWALIWINVVGLGPFAGVLAIMTSDFGALGKLFSEAVETADNKPVEGVVSTGGGGWHRVRFGLLPQIMPVILSQILYYFESNTRSATIIGIVGAGGIGLHLSEQIRTLEWQHVSFLIIMILVVVAIIDFISEKLRKRLVS